MMCSEALVTRHPASFRDPAGFIFESGGDLYRAVHPNAVADVEALFSSGLHDKLVKAGLLVGHRRLVNSHDFPEGWVVLQPDRLPVVSYACEWTDAQLHAAALLTLELQKQALRHGLTLKDASSFNVQFAGSRPVFIDLLSFTHSRDDGAWVGYRQFCEHFLGPLALRRYIPGATAPSQATLDGTPLALAAALLPAATWLRPGLVLHLHLHARATARRPSAAATPASARTGTSGNFGLQLVESLTRTVQGLAPRRRSSAWSDYRTNNPYSSVAADAKLAFLLEAVARATPGRAVDLGANDGHYARALAAHGVACTAVEVDSACAEAIHACSLASPQAGLLNTLRVDLTNPTPSHGWAGTERASFTERLRCDMSLSLALIHHLSIAHQVPFDAIASYLADLAPHAIVEYVPPDDPMALQLLAARTGVTDSYLATLSEAAFRDAFDARFECVARSESPEGGRILHHFQRRSS